MFTKEYLVESVFQNKQKQIGNPTVVDNKASNTIEIALPILT